MSMMQTPREQLSLAAQLESLIGSARVAPATPSSPELLAAAEAIFGSFAGKPDADRLRAIRTRS